jgi:hypothetical protein
MMATGSWYFPNRRREPSYGQSLIVTFGEQPRREQAEGRALG